MNYDVIKQQFVKKYLEMGEVKFSRFLILSALIKLIAFEKEIYKGKTPNLEFLGYHNQLLIMYRREGDQVYLQLAKIFRKIANKIYRVMLKKNMTNIDDRFLNVIPCNY